MHLYGEFRLWLIGFALVYCVGVTEQENPKSHIEMFQNNIYYYERIKWYIVSTQESCLQKTYQERNDKLSQMTIFLCMHEILVHAQHSCACTKLLCMHWRGQGPRPGPNKKQPRVRPGAADKNLVHAQESWA